MQRAFLSFFLTMLVGGLTEARATTTPAAPAAATDTIVVRLPNKATLTLTVRDAAQLRELKNYHLDSLTSRLATYITQAEAAAKTGTTDQVTMRFYPDKDQPGQNLPEEIRITARKPGAQEARGNTKTQVFLNKKFGIVTRTDEDGTRSFNIDGRRKSAGDSTKKNKEERRPSVYFRWDQGLSTFVNSTSTATRPNVPSLSTWGSTYINFGIDYVQYLTYTKRAKLALTIGPEFSGNNFRMRGNNQWVQRNGQTLTEGATSIKIDQNELYLGSLNLPVMLRLKLRNKQDKRTLSAGLGGFVGYRVTSNINTRYREFGSDDKFNNRVYGALNLNDWQYGLQGEVGFHALRFFAKYNLNEMFRDNRGPQTHVMAFGLRVVGF